MSIIATLKNGTQYPVRLKKPNLNDHCRKLGSDGGWDKYAEININGTWYHCLASKTKDQYCVRVGNKELKAALNIPASFKADPVIVTNDWHGIYHQLLAEVESEAKTQAETLTFTTLKFTHHTSHKFMSFYTDNEKLNKVIEFCPQVIALKNALKHVTTKDIAQYSKSTDYDDYSISEYFEVPQADIDALINLETPTLKEAKEKQVKSEIAQQRRVERDENIKNGAIYFTCESKPHDEDLTGVLLNRPAPNGGLFTIDHRIGPELFSRVKSFGTYWDKDWLEECDMFTSSPGWRFSEKAVKEFLKTNRVFIDNIEVEK